MKTATVRELRNRYTTLLDWLGAGEEIVITQRGRPVARLVPEPAKAAGKVDWSASPEIRRDRGREKRLSARASAKLLAEAGGGW